MKRHICRNCGIEFVKPHNPQRQYSFCSHKCANVFHNQRGERHLIECSQCKKSMEIYPYELKKGRRFCSKECSDKYKDRGKTSLTYRLRTSLKYIRWRTTVFIRDNYTCQECGERGGALNADHILRFSEYPELRFEVSNGRTLCINCHLLTKTFGNRKRIKCQI